jgi:hypothetical protein
MKKGDDQETGLSSKAETAFRRAAAKVIQRAKQTGTPIVVWREGRVEEIPSETLEPVTARGRSKSTKAQ